jgi:hypothetical protein
MAVLAFVRRTVKRSDLLYRLALAGRNWRDLLLWVARGRPLPPPPIVKQRQVREFGRRFGLRVLVETGTYTGDMLAATAANFERLHSIELSEMLQRKAAERFRNQPHIQVHHGDSAAMLPSVLAQLSEPCLFWLDAHYSGGVTAMGGRETPIVLELECIFDRRCERDVILIDDARCFDGHGGYPALDELRRYITERRPGGRMRIAGDIIVITPGQ